MAAYPNKYAAQAKVVLSFLNIVSHVTLSRNYCSSGQGAKIKVQPSLHGDYRKEARSHNSETWCDRNLKVSQKLEGAWS
jgi:hypothetical protein